MAEQMAYAVQYPFDNLIQPANDLEQAKNWIEEAEEFVRDGEDDFGETDIERYEGAFIVIWNGSEWERA